MKRIDSLNASQEGWRTQVQIGGEVKLCRAIILQALSDIAKPQTTTSRKRWREMAIRWVMDDRRHPWSFLWCVEYGFSECDIDVVVDIIRRNVKEGGENGYFWNRLLRRSSIRRPCD